VVVWNLDTLQQMQRYRWHDNTVSAFDIQTGQPVQTVTNIHLPLQSSLPLLPSCIQYHSIPILDFVDWMALSYSPNITWKTISKHLDKPWNWSYLSQNPNLFVIPLQKIREHFAAKCILRNWRNAISNPNYQICNKRLLREFGELPAL
jgi:hypothetical protein